MQINSRIRHVTEQANKLLREKKSDILVLIAPSDNAKGWCVDVCNNYHTGDEDTQLRERLEACNTLDELTTALDGYATNVPNVERSHEYK